MSRRIWAFVVALAVGFTGSFALDSSAKAETGSSGHFADKPTAEVAKKAPAKLAQKRWTRASVTFENANEASPTNTEFATRLFVHRGDKLRKIADSTSKLDAGESGSFLSRRFWYRGEYNLRAETWQGDTLVASKNVQGSGAIPVVNLVYGEFEPEDVPGTQGGLRITDSITGISFGKALLFEPGANLADPNVRPLYVHVFVKVDEMDTSSTLSTGETSKVIPAPLGTFKVVLLTTETTPRYFVFDGTTTVGAEVTELDARIN